MHIELTDQNFEKEIAGAKLPMLVDFYADWCGPCRVLGPVLEKVSEEMKDKMVLAKANVDNAPQASGKFNVEKIPTVVLFKSGQPVGGFVGLADEESIKKWLSENI